MFFFLLAGSSAPSMHPVVVKLTTLNTALFSRLPLIKKPVNRSSTVRKNAEKSPLFILPSFCCSAAAHAAPKAAKKLMSELA